MKEKEGCSIRGLILVLALIAAAVAAIVYVSSLHQKHLNREKWKDYDECGLA